MFHVGKIDDFRWNLVEREKEYSIQKSGIKHDTSYNIDIDVTSLGYSYNEKTNNKEDNNDA